jgi:predicted metal-binding membrane protein
MTDTALEHVFRRDRAVVAAALALITALAWTYIAWLAATMDMAAAPVGMPGMSMPGMMAPELSSWSAVDFLFTFTMWAVMMVGMMTPSVAPMVLIYARVARQALAQGKPFASTGWFVAGYLLAWTSFALVATAAQWGLEQSALLTPGMVTASNVFGGFVLIAAGLYQWTPIKEACLSQCQAPLVFIQRHGGLRRDIQGSLRLGTQHGLYCIGCCWVLMALLFVGGVMNLLWIAAISIFVLLEKVVPAGRILSRVAGLGFIAAGIWLVTR